ncbi:MAG: hypothetical protein HZA36_00485 [Parcubacteria group bacterium]|nr:hypothetical protein [Parcubacteria group bacterium]
MKQFPSSQPKNTENIEFEKNLERGHYTGILENYMEKTKWSRERVARDAWQNFFDANKFTLDGLGLETQEDKDGTTISIKGSAEYPYTRLLHLGGGYKEDPKKSAGGHHEGTRIIALHMLRDFGFSKILFRSQDWELEFYLDEPPRGSTEEKNLRGLYIRLKKHNTPREGNDIFLKSNDPEMARIFSDARDLFYHSNNPDFQNPTVDNKKAGFSLHFGKPGNFYLNGQRISYDVRGKWETLPNFTFWSHETPETPRYTIDPSRDRDVITEREVDLVYLEFLVNSLSEEELEKTLKALEPFYALPNSPLGYDRERHIGDNLLRLVVNRRMSLGDVPTFDKNFVALDEQDFLETLKGLGFIPCHPFLANIGMMRASEMKNEILELQEYTPTPEHEKRIESLQSLARDILQTTDTRTIAHVENLLGVERGDTVGTLQRLSDLNAKKIRLFEGKHPYLKGLYDEQFVWVSKDSLETPDIEDALATYLHELCHKFGNDQSEIFSYALTDVLRRLAKYARTNPEGMHTIQQEWEAVRIDRAWKTIQDLNVHLSNIALGEDPFKRRQRLDSLNITDDLAQSLEKIVVTHFTHEDTTTAIKQIFGSIQRDPLLEQWGLLTQPSANYPPPPSNEETRILKEANNQLWNIDSLIRKLQEQINAKLGQLSTNPTIQQRKDGKWAIKREKLGIPQLEAEIELKKKEKKKIFESVKELREKEERYEHSERILLSFLQKRNPITLYGIPFDPFDIYAISNFFPASLKLLLLRWEKKTFNHELFKKEFSELLEWAKTQHIAQQEKIKKTIGNEVLNAYERAQNNATPLTFAYAQLCHEALENMA